MSEQSDAPLHSVDIACDIIEALSQSDGIRVTALADKTGRSKSTVHDHLKTLEQNNLVVKEDAEYRLSIQILSLAQHVRNQVGNYNIIREELDELAAETGENAQFGIEEHGRVGYFYKTSGPKGVQTVSSVGAFQPMHSTALGKCILANLPEEQVDEIIDQYGLPAMTEETITNRDALFKELEQVRDQGYAVDDQENVLGLRCIGAPVIVEGEIFGAVSVSGPASRFDDTRLIDELAEQVKRTANVIELNSQYS